MNKTIKHSWRVLLLAPLLLAFVVYVNNGYKPINQSAPMTSKMLKKRLLHSINGLINSGKITQMLQPEIFLMQG